MQVGRRGRWASRRLTTTKPTIAAISGWCLAGGLELALWCDLRIATRGSRFGYPERRWGVPLIDGGTLRLPRIVGLGRALDLILTGRIVETDEALDWGLLTEVVDEGDHLDRAIEIAEGLARFPRDAALRPAFGHRGLHPPARGSLEFEAAIGLDSVTTGVEGAAASPPARAAAAPARASETPDGKPGHVSPPG